jgi:hypothetical protein
MDGLAQSAKTSFAKADLEQVKKIRRDNLAALHQRDIDLAEEAARICRDQALLDVMLNPSSMMSH